MPVEELKTIVSELMKADSGTIDGSTILGGLLASSLGRARLDATLRTRLGINNPGVYTVRTFGELCQLFGQGMLPKTVAASRPFLPPSGNGIALGVDIQAVEALPKVVDYWEGDFYQQHFTRQEIAYALLQPHPRESFAAAWCAKEALRKADRRWADTDWKLTEITHHADGRPALRSGEDVIPCAVSLSHTEGFAVAVVAIAQSLSSPQEVLPSPSNVLSPEPAAQGSGTSLILSIVALLISLAAACYVALR